MRKTLYVSPQGTNWKVHWGFGSQAKVFLLKTSAVKYARQLVGKHIPGYCSQIKVQKADGVWQTEWTYGKDPYPPRG